MLPQAIYDIAETCAQLGVVDAVISPGSRNAALTIAIARHPKIRAYSVIDERSAAFIGLGLGQKSKAPTVLICTSGSAGLNYGPAVAEAFFQQIPLIVITADRPPEWIGQWDGQTINQRGMFEGHVKASYDLPVSTDNQDTIWEINRKVSEAINISSQTAKGPVHINIPIREPFYPSKDQKLEYNDEVKIIKSEPFEHRIAASRLETLQKELSNYCKVLVVGGQNPQDKELLQAVETIVAKEIPVIGDIISNLHRIQGVVKNADLLLKKL